MLYFDYPLEQGLRPVKDECNNGKHRYFDYPLEQGLRRNAIHFDKSSNALYFDYPLEQGLRPLLPTVFSLLFIVF